ncbi:MAG: hypothetical protein JWP49_1147 [Phenylobacterium sp.]|nr:hypothetical protein [Phenylobacterium sp.]
MRASADPVEAAEAQVLARPGSADSWLALAEVHRQAGRPQAALAACDAGLTAVPRSAALLAARGEALRLLGRPGEAGEAFRQALDVEPGQDGAGFGLALLAVEAGDAQAAHDRLAPLRAVQPDRPQVLWLAARIALLAGRAQDAARDLERLLASPLPAERQADARLLLSEAYDQLGDHTAAFAAAAAGKAIQRRLYAPQARAREGIEARLERLDAWFRAADPAPWRTPPPPGARPAPGHVFLVGFPRSGTTLLEQALAGHPEVAALEEAPTLAAAHDAFLTSAEGLQRLAELGAAEAQAWRARYWAEVAAHGVEVAGKLFLDKAPAATEDLPLVAKLFPDAKVLFAIRDPRDVVLSCFRQNFRMNAMTYAFTDLAETAACYDACFALADTYRQRLPLDLLEVRHEDLLADFEGGLTRICGFVGLDLQPAMLDVAATARRRAVRTPSAPQVRLGLNSRGLGRWRAYARPLAPVLPRLQPWVTRFGYPD